MNIVTKIQSKITHIAKTSQILLTNPS